MSCPSLVMPTWGLMSTAALPDLQKRPRQPATALGRARTTNHGAVEHRPATPPARSTPWMEAADGLPYQGSAPASSGAQVWASDVWHAG